MINQQKNGGHRTSKIVKSRKSYSNGHLPYHLFIRLLLSAHTQAWRGVWICVRRRMRKNNYRERPKWRYVTSEWRHDDWHNILSHGLSVESTCKMILINLISMRVPSFHFLYQGWPVYVQGLHLLNVTTDVAEIMVPVSCSGRRIGLMVSALVPGASGPGSSPGRGHCVVFLGKTLNSHSASLYRGV